MFRTSYEEDSISSRLRSCYYYVKNALMHSCDVVSIHWSCESKFPHFCATNQTAIVRGCWLSFQPFQDVMQQSMMLYPLSYLSMGSIRFIPRERKGRNLRILRMRVRRPTSTRSRNDERLGCRSSSSQTAQDNQIHCYIYIQLALQFLFLLPGGGRSVLGVGKHRVEWASPKPSFQPQPNDRLQPSSLPQGITCDLSSVGTGTGLNGVLASLATLR